MNYQSTISIPVPTSTFLELAGFLEEMHSDRDPVETVDLAISYWMENAAMKSDDLLPELVKLDLGYRWKDVWLPHGTKLRMRYKGGFHYAKVDGDDVIWNGESVSPAEFVNTVTNSNRNAWRDIEINRPEDSHWIEAQRMRAMQEEASQKVMAELFNESKQASSEASTPVGGDELYAQELNALPDALRDAGQSLLDHVRQYSDGCLRKAASGKFVEHPNNFWTVKVQPQARTLSLTVYGPPESHRESIGVEIKSDRGSYSRFLFEEAGQLQAVASIIRRAYELKG